MAAQNPEMFKKARLESEPEFCNVLRRNGYVDVVQGTTDDDYKHTDVFAWRKGRCWTFDVKDQTNKWKGVSRKYRISGDMYNDIKANVEKYIELNNDVNKGTDYSEMTVFFLVFF